MFVFIDESGDSGFKIDSGSSRYFVISLVLFNNEETLLACDQSIESLRTNLRWKPKREFHFKNNSFKIREELLKVISKHKFTYYVVIIDKSSKDTRFLNIQNKIDFYEYACKLLLELTRDILQDAVITIDKTGEQRFITQLNRSLKRDFNSDSKKIKKINQKRSHSSNLLQIADYIAGITRRAQTEEQFKVLQSIIKKQKGKTLRYPKKSSPSPISRRERK